LQTGVSRVAGDKEGRKRDRDLLSAIETSSTAVQTVGGHVVLFEEMFGLTWTAES
jgi:hypothetical protein